MADRSRRVIRAPVRLIAEDDPQPQAPPQRQQRAPRRQAIPVLEVPNSPVRATAKTPKAPAKAKKTESRTLDINLSDAPPSDDIKFTSTWGDGDNEFWQKFYTPQDNTTQEYREACEKLSGFLPANFELIRGEPNSFGVANLELKKEFVLPIKRTPLYSKLEKGDYEIAQSKSDKTNIAGSIKFFRNNLASFIQYKDADDISWVITHHRQLVAEILEYYANKDKTSLATIKGRFNAITRIFRIAYETKNYELYDKYSSCIIFLTQQFELDEFNNELSEEELKKFVTFDVVLNKQKELQKQFELLRNKQSRIGYDLNQDLLLVSLYSLIPPLRLEPMTLKFTDKTQKEKDWIVIRPDEVLMDLNEIKKKHSAILFRLTNDAPVLAAILRQSYELYPREYVFTHYKKYPDVSRQASPVTLCERLNSIFSYTGKRVGVNALRSSYVSYANSEAIRNGKQLTVNQKEKIAYKMRTSRTYMDQSYLKIFPTEQYQIKQEHVSDIVVRPINEALPTERQNARTKTYYYDNKEKVLAQQKEYQGKKSLYEKARNKMLYYLNSDPEYNTKMKDRTKQKYDFKKEGNKWI